MGCTKPFCENVSKRPQYLRQVAACLHAADLAMIPLLSMQQYSLTVGETWLLIAGFCRERWSLLVWMISQDLESNSKPKQVVRTSSFFTVGNSTLKQAAWRGCGVFLIGTVQNQNHLYNPVPCAPRWSCLSREVGAHDPLRALPTWPIPWFCDLKVVTSWNGNTVLRSRS